MSNTQLIFEKSVKDFFRHQIKLLGEIDKTLNPDSLEEKQSIWLLHIYAFTSVIEACFRDLVTSYLYMQFHNTDDDVLKNKIIEIETQMTEKSTWGNKLKLFNEVFQKSVKDFVDDSENFTAIEKLFAYRNNLIHGNPFLYEIDPAKKYADLSGGFRKIFEYFRTKKLITMSEFEQPHKLFINKEIVDFFHKHTIKFINGLEEKIKDEYGFSNLFGVLP